MTGDSHQARSSGGTLGDVLYADGSQPLLLESDWVELACAVAAGEASALHALYERTHRPVFTLILRITSSRQAAEALTLELYRDLWKGASRYDATAGTVIAWIMNLARAKALGRLRAGQKGGRTESQPDAVLLSIDMPDYRDVLELKERSAALQSALRVLTAQERAALEMTFFCERSHLDVARRLDLRVGALQATIRRALHGLSAALFKETHRGFFPRDHCPQAAPACVHALQALPAAECREMEAHLAGCWQCRRELRLVRPVIGSFVYWPTDVLRPSPWLQDRLAPVAAISQAREAFVPARAQWPAPEWRQVAPDISCKLLATDIEQHRVSMLVRLVPGGEYPPHTHCGVEELHLLDGELWIEERRLLPGDYHRAEPGSGDRRVWSETGCACVLVTSLKDVLG